MLKKLIFISLLEFLVVASLFIPGIYFSPGLWSFLILFLFLVIAPSLIISTMVSSAILLRRQKKLGRKMGAKELIFTKLLIDGAGALIPLILYVGSGMII